jgi:hypothetical protein
MTVPRSPYFYVGKIALSLLFCACCSLGEFSHLLFLVFMVHCSVWAYAAVSGHGAVDRPPRPPPLPSLCPAPPAAEKIKIKIKIKIAFFSYFLALYS